MVRLTNTFVADSNKSRRTWPRFETKILSDTYEFIIVS